MSDLLDEPGSQWEHDPDCPEHGYGCCPSCKGYGLGGSASGPESSGRCWDCKGTGHQHDLSERCRWCSECEGRRLVADEFDDEEIIPDRRISGPPSFRAYHVTILECGHQIAEVSR